MNRIITQVWNRKLRMTQAVSKCARWDGGAGMMGASGTGSRVRRHPLALACGFVLAGAGMGFLPLSAHAGSTPSDPPNGSPMLCPGGIIVYTGVCPTPDTPPDDDPHGANGGNGVGGVNGGNASAGAVGSGGAGSNHGATDGSANDGGNGGAPGQGADGSGGSSAQYSHVGGGGRGGDYGDNGAGGGGAGGEALSVGHPGGGGGGGGLGGRLSGSHTGVTDAYHGGSGGNGGDAYNPSGLSPLGSGGGGGGGGGAGLWLGSNTTFRTSAAVTGGRGGDGGNGFANESGDGGGGGAGMLVDGGGADITSSSSISGGAGGDSSAVSAGSGGTGVWLGGGGAANTLTTSGSISGGAGGSTAANGYAAGGSGGTGVSTGDALNLTSTGSIAGGDGGRGGSSFARGGSGGNGADAVDITTAAGGHSAFDNHGSVQGGSGGVGGAAIGSNGGMIQGGNGGSGGNGAVLANTTLTNSGSIRGGNAGERGNSIGSIIAADGKAGVGVHLLAGSTGSNTRAGTITGGNGAMGQQGTVAGNGAAGLVLDKGTSFDNGGTVTGGNGGSVHIEITPRPQYPAGMPGSGGNAITASGNVTVINSGKLSGGEAGRFTGHCLHSQCPNTAVDGNAISFTGGGNKLILEKGSDVTGNAVSAGGDTLALGGGTDARFDLSGVQASKSETYTGTQYIGFSKFEKTGASTWTVTGAANGEFHGGITIDGGTLQLGDGVTSTSISGGPVNVGAGATLSGFGSVAASTATINEGATLSPGAGTGLGALTIDGPLGMLGNLAIGIDGTGVGNSDFVDVMGDVTFGSSSFFNFFLGGDSNQQAGDSFQFFNADAFLNFADASGNFHCSGLLSGLTCGLSQMGNGLYLTLNDSSDGGGSTNVPEPGSLGMLGLGLFLLGGGVGWRKWRDDKES